MRLDSDTKIKHLNDSMSHFAHCEFEWGVSDCCQFVGDYIHRCTGDDLRLAYGKYTTAVGAKRAQTKTGSFEDTVNNEFAQVEAGLAQRGDIAIVATPDGPALAVVTGNGCWTMCPHGLSPVDGEILKVWRI